MIYEFKNKNGKARPFKVIKRTKKYTHYSYFLNGLQSSIVHKEDNETFDCHVKSGFYTPVKEVENETGKDKYKEFGVIYNKTLFGLDVCLYHIFESNKDLYTIFQITVIDGSDNLNQIHIYNDCSYRLDIISKVGEVSVRDAQFFNLLSSISTSIYSHIDQLRK